uniref:Uncharacterized protein n=1 Tax=Roseihalotalea indica TaxID=2867963 RepID=A0AA49GS30_9BACT|nr:hypothetical protein K4G66_12475 [Tunicatimonas sp. TK19036]
MTTYLLYSIVGVALLTLFGLCRPWYAAWWSPVANRKKVLQTYGLLLLLLLTTYTLLSWLQ